MSDTMIYFAVLAVGSVLILTSYNRELPIGLQQLCRGLGYSILTVLLFMLFTVVLDIIEHST